MEAIAIDFIGFFCAESYLEDIFYCYVLKDNSIHKIAYEKFN
jgi:hypothetical protein